MARTFGIQSLLRAGELEIVLPNQRLSLKGGARPSCKAYTESVASVAKIFWRGNRWVWEAFMDGDWDCQTCPR